MGEIHCTFGAGDWGDEGVVADCKSKDRGKSKKTQGV